MKKMEIVVPESLMPKPQPGKSCPCIQRPIDLQTKKGLLTWIVDVDEPIEKGQIICEGEADKKTVEIAAPCSGVLVEKCIEDEHVFRAGDVLGYIQP